MKNKTKWIPFFFKKEENLENLVKVNFGTWLYIMTLRIILPLVLLMAIVLLRDNVLLRFSDSYLYGHSAAILLALSFIYKVKFDEESMFRLGVITGAIAIILHFNINLYVFSVDRFFESTFLHFYIYLILGLIFRELLIFRRFTFFSGKESGFWHFAPKEIKKVQKIFNFTYFLINVLLAIIIFAAGLKQSVLKHEFARSVGIQNEIQIKNK